MSNPFETPDQMARRMNVPLVTFPETQLSRREAERLRSVHPEARVDEAWDRMHPERPQGEFTTGGQANPSEVERLLRPGLRAEFRPRGVAVYDADNERID